MSRTIIDLDSNDGAPNRLCDIFFGDDDMSDHDKQEMGALLYGMMTNQIQYGELVKFFCDKMSRKYILESSDPEILAIVTIPGEVLDKVIEDE